MYGIPQPVVAVVSQRKAKDNGVRIPLEDVIG